MSESGFSRLKDEQDKNKSCKFSNSVNPDADNEKKTSESGFSGLKDEQDKNKSCKFSNSVNPDADNYPENPKIK